MQLQKLGTRRGKRAAMRAKQKTSKSFVLLSTQKRSAAGA